MTHRKAPPTKPTIKVRPEHVQKLIIGANLSVQHRCMVCDVLLEAFSRPESQGKWVCLEEHGHLANDLPGPDGITRANKAVTPPAN